MALAVEIISVLREDNDEKEAEISAKREFWGSG